METMIFVGLLTILTVAATITIGSGMSAVAAAQMSADNATIAGNMTGGNMTMGPSNMTDTNSTKSGNISAVGGVI